MLGESTLPASSASVSALYSLTPAARAAIEHAIRAAGSSSRPGIGEDALLTALFATKRGIAFRVLQAAVGSNVDVLIESLTTSGESHRGGRRGRPTALDRLLQEAARLSREFHSARIGTGHMLLAALGDASDATLNTLARMGASADNLRRETVAQLASSDAEEDLLGPDAIVGQSTGEFTTNPLSSASAAGRACPVCRQFNAHRARYCGSCGAAVDIASRVGVDRMRRFMAHLLAGIEARRLGRRGLAAAVAELRRAVRLIRADVRPLLELGRAHADAGQRGVALRWYRRAVRREPLCAVAWLEGADCFGHYAVLRRAFWLRRALRRLPHDARLRERFEQDYRRLRRWERFFVGRPRHAAAEAAP